MTNHLWMRKLRLASIATAVLLAGCAPLSPQIFSDDMLPQQPPPVSQQAAAGSFAEAKAGALQAMRSYNAAVQELSGVTPKMSVGLIALSALALLKSISHPNGSDIAGIGVIGSAAYLYGSTAVSKPRQLTYLAGSRALACSVAASAPYDVPATDLQAWTAARTELSQNRDALQQERNRYAPLLKTEITQPSAKTVPADCAQTPRPVCTPSPAVMSNATPEETQRFNSQCPERLAAWTRRCVVTAAKPLTLTANPLLVAAIAQADKAIAAATALDGEARLLTGKVANAATDLRWQSQQIQLRVSEEVLKTEPEPAAVLAATGGLRSAAFSLTGAPAFKASTGDAQSAPTDGAQSKSASGSTRSRALDANLQTAIDAIDRATEQLITSHMKLAGLLRPTQEAALSARVTLQQCVVPAQVSASASPATPVVEATTTPTTSATDVAVLAMTDEERQWLGLPATPTEAQQREAITKCQRAMGAPAPTGLYDKDTRSEVRKRDLCLNIFNR